MFFYVVQTRKSKKSKPCLTVVPSNWVKDGGVYWPPNNLITLAKNEDSLPDVQNWKKQKCKVVAEAATFDQAESSLQKLEMLTDSEDAVELLMGTRSHPAKRKPKFTSKLYTLAPPVSKKSSKMSARNGSTFVIEKEQCPTVASSSDQFQKAFGAFCETNDLLAHSADHAVEFENHLATLKAAPVSSSITAPLGVAPTRFVHPPKIVANRCENKKVATASTTSPLMEINRDSQVWSSTVASDVQHHKPASEVSVQDIIVQDPSGQMICSAELPVESNQAKRQMFTMMSASDALGSQYLQLANGSWIEVSMQNTHPSENMQSNEPSITDSCSVALPEKPVQTTSTESQVMNVMNAPADYNEVSKKLDLVLNRLDRMEHAVEKIMSFIADTQRFMSMKSIDHESARYENTRKRKINEDFSEIEALFPVPGEQELLMLENSLKTQAVNDKFFDYFEFSYQLNGKRNSGSFFKLLIRRILVPTLLAPFSWKGQSRNVQGTERPENRSFKDTFPTFVNFVHRVVRAADCEFTQEQCHNAFGLYLRNKHTEISRYTGEGYQREAHTRRRKKVDDTTSNELTAAIPNVPSEQSIASENSSSASTTSTCSASDEETISNQL